MDFLLECLAKDAIPGTVLKSKALMVLQKRVGQPEFVSSEKLVAAYRQYQEIKEVAKIIFDQLCTYRQGEEVYAFLLDIAQHSNDLQKYFFALQGIERIGEMASLRGEIFFLPE